MKGCKRGEDGERMIQTHIPTQRHLEKGLGEPRVVAVHEVRVDARGPREALLHQLLHALEPVRRERRRREHVLRQGLLPRRVLLVGAVGVKLGG